MTMSWRSRLLVSAVACDITDDVHVVSRSYGRCGVFGQPQVHRCSADEHDIFDNRPEDLSRELE
jgi:hypothetical protein